MSDNSSLLMGILLKEAADSWKQMPLSLVIVEAFIIGIGVIGNCWLLYKGLSKKALRNSPFHLLLLNQSFVHLLLASFCYTSFTFKLREGISKNHLQVEHCMYFTLFLLVLQQVSLFTNGFVAVNRALSCHPLQPVSVTLNTRKATCLVLVIIWVTSAIMCTCTWVTHHKSWSRLFSCRTVNDIMDDLLSGIDPRNLNQAKPIASRTMAATMMVVILVNTASYAVIVAYLLKQQNLGRKAGIASDRRQTEKKRALLVIVLLLCVLLACWIPITVALSIEPHMIATDHEFLMMASLEAAIDPILCMVTMSVFRPECFSRLAKKVNPATPTMPAHSTQVSHIAGNERRGTTTAWN